MRPDTRLKYLLALVVVGTLGLATVGYLHYRDHYEDTTLAVRNELAAIADLKVNLISRWRAERVADARVIMENSFAATRFRQFLKSPRPGLKTELLQWMESRRLNYGLDGVYLFDDRAQLRLSVGQEMKDVTERTRSHIHQAITSRTIVLSDLQRNAKGDSTDIDLDVVVPVGTTEAIAGILLMRVDPGRTLYPIVQSWPRPTQTAETLFLRRSGDAVVFLNELRHRHGAAFSLYTPITGASLVSIMAVKGIEGIVEAQDYRGVAVLAALRKVPNSPWFLAAKIDREEIDSPVDEQAFLVALVVVGLVLAGGFGVWTHRRGQIATYYRRQYEAETQERMVLQKYEYLTRYANDIILLYDRDGNILDANEKALATYGYTREQILRLHARDLRSPAEKPTVGQHIAAVLSEEGSVFETVHRRRNGTTFPVEVSTRAIRAEEKLFLQSIIRDISERRRMEGALRESEERFRRLTENAPDLIYRYRLLPDQGFEYVSPAATAITGYTPQEHYADPELGRKLVHPDDRPRLMQIMGDVEALQRPLQLRWIAKDGRIIWTEQRNVPVYDNEGRVVAIEGIARDITEQKAAEEERKALEERLMQAQRLESVGTLAGGIAHDFNNILGIILGHVSLLDQHAGNPQQLARTTDSITRATQRGTTLVRQLLTFARKTEAVFESINANETVEDLVKMMEATFPKTIAFRCTLDRSVPRIVADASQLHQALLNLCVNARDAMPDGGTITIRTGVTPGSALLSSHPEAREEEYLWLSVTDTGEGMEEYIRSRMFEPFFTTKGVGKGTGLGLAVVHGVVKSHRGFVDVSSRMGRGTTFTLYFPVQDVEKRIRKEPPPHTAPPPRGGDETILLVEDEEMLMDLVRTLLQTNGYRVIPAMHGIEAVDLYVKHSGEIDLVLSDLGLPLMDGRQVVQRIKKINPAVQVIVASGYFDPAVRSELAREGVADFVPKPYDPRDLLFRIREALDETKKNRR